MVHTNIYPIYELLERRTHGGADPADLKLQGLLDLGQQQDILEESRKGSSIDSIAEDTGPPTRGMTHCNEHL